jgi:hypothetical protein
VAFFSVTIAYDPVPTASRPPTFLSNFFRHTAQFFSNVVGSHFPSGLSAVGCRLSAISRKLLISNSFPRSSLDSFFPRRFSRAPFERDAHPSTKSFPCVSYKNIRGWGSGPTNFPRAHRPCSSPHGALITSHAPLISRQPALSVAEG